MLYVLSNSFDPYYNLATEEYLLKNSMEDIFMLWRSEPAVIVGKHQNAMAEINYSYIRENNIKIARRLSGGGTVVHDLQNLNFSFIANGEEGKLIDFKRFVNPIIDYLATLNIKAHIGKTNDIRIGELKISGNAEHVYRKRVLHHGTLLYNSDLSRLREAINTSPGKYIDKAVQSNRASVTNIIDHLEKNTSIDDFTRGLTSFIVNKSKSRIHQLSLEENKAIDKLVAEKYKTQDWIWGYSPKYTFKNQFRFDHKSWNVELFVEKGLICHSSITINKKEASVISKCLLNRWHLKESLVDTLQSIDSENYRHSNISKLAENFF